MRSQSDLFNIESGRDDEKELVWTAAGRKRRYVEKEQREECFPENVLKKTDDTPKFESFPSLPVTTVQPQADVEIPASDSYTSFAEIKKFSNVQIQEENNKEHVYLVSLLSAFPHSFRLIP